MDIIQAPDLQQMGSQGLAVAADVRLISLISWPYHFITAEKPKRGCTEKSSVCLSICICLCMQMLCVLCWSWHWLVNAIEYILNQCFS